MITIRKSNERGEADHGWLKARHSFSFANYYDPQHMGFRTLRVLNDDTVLGGGGFDTHPHRDMEIITYVISGALAHRDSMGNGRVIRSGEFQYMAAGTGVQHSEFNHSPIEAVHLIQTWVVPDRRGAQPAYAERQMTTATSGQLHLITSKTGRDNSIAINQDADLYLAKLQKGETVTHTLRPGRHAWVQVADGSVILNGQPLQAGDGAAIEDETTVTLGGENAAQVLLFDLN